MRSRSTIYVLRSTYGPTGNRGTRKNVTVAIRQFCKWASEEGYVDVSPATRLRYPKIPRRTPEPLPLRVDTQLLNVAENVRDRLALAILLDPSHARGR